MINNKKIKISKKEADNRKQACVFARASVEFEGLYISKEKIKQTERYISGEISLDEFLEVV